MTLRLTEDETDALRRQAEVEGRSMQDIARRGINEYLVRHARTIERRTLLGEITDDHRELLDRLRDA